jgi:peptidoglycan-associated lipoprotein
MRKTSSLIIIAGVALAAACSSSPPPETPPPKPTPAEVARQQFVQDSLDALTQAQKDSIEAIRQMAILDRARADSVEQARLAAEAAARKAALESSAKNTELRNELGAMVHFEVAQAQLASADRAALDRKVAILNANPSVRLQITGACDDRGSVEYNQALGTRRAVAVRKYLVEKGIDVSRLDEMSSGEKSPIASGNDEMSWAQNRRAEFVIVSGEAPLAMQ